MVPAYAAVLMLIIVLVLRLAKLQSKVRTKRLLKNSLLTVVVLALSVSSVYLSRLLPVFTMPEPTGSYGIGTISQHLTDVTRD